MFNYPHGDLHGLNLDWFLDQWKKFQNSFSGSFTATAQETASPNDPADVNVTYDPNTGIYNFAFDIPKGVKPTGYLIAYQEGTSGTTVPTGTWVATPPAVAQGNYLWSMTRVIYNDGTFSETYAVSRQGVDGAGSPATQNPLMDGTVAVGSSAKFAREDHRHPSDTSRLATSALSNSTPAMDGTGASGTSVNVARADHVHPSDTSKLNASAFVLSNSTPAMDGTGASGTSSNVARADHVHPSDTTKMDASAIGWTTHTFNNITIPSGQTYVLMGSLSDFGITVPFEYISLTIQGFSGLTAPDEAIVIAVGSNGTDIYALGTAGTSATSLTLKMVYLKT